MPEYMHENGSPETAEELKQEVGEQKYAEMGLATEGNWATIAWKKSVSLYIKFINNTTSTLYFCVDARRELRRECSMSCLKFGCSWNRNLALPEEQTSFPLAPNSSATKYFHDRYILVTTLSRNPPSEKYSIHSYQEHLDTLVHFSYEVRESDLDIVIPPDLIPKTAARDSSPMSQASAPDVDAQRTASRASAALPQC